MQTQMTAEETITTPVAERRDWGTVAGRNHWISWSAVFAGVVTGTAVQATLGLLGLGIGASSVDPLQEANPFSGLGIGAGIWLFASTLIAYYAAGWIAGKSAGLVSRANGALHGIATWAASTVAIVLVVSGLLGGVATGAVNLLGSAAQTVRAFGLPNNVEKNLASTANTAATGNTAENQNASVPMPPRQTGEEAARATAATAFMGFVLLLLSAVVCSWGGAMTGARKYVQNTSR